MAKSTLQQRFDTAVKKVNEKKQELCEAEEELIVAHLSLLSHRLKKLYGEQHEVIRIEDNKKGVLKPVVKPCFYIKSPCEIKFYPYTKKGELSKVASGYIFDDSPKGLLKEYKPIVKKGDKNE